MGKDKIKIVGHFGTWYVIDESYFKGEKVYLLEHEQLGDEAFCIIVNGNKEIILDQVSNGFDDLYN